MPPAGSTIVVNSPTLTSNKGGGDPGADVFRLLLSHGFEGVGPRRCRPGSTPRELTDTGDLPVDRRRFVREALAELGRCGVDGPRALEAVAHCATECAFGRRAIGDNRGRVKLKRGDDAAFRAKHGVGLPCWRAGARRGG